MNFFLLFDKKPIKEQIEPFYFIDPMGKKYSCLKKVKEIYCLLTLFNNNFFFIIFEIIRVFNCLNN